MKNDQQDQRKTTQPVTVDDILPLQVPSKAPGRRIPVAEQRALEANADARAAIQALLDENKRLRHELASTGRDAVDAVELAAGLREELTAANEQIEYYQQVFYNIPGFALAVSQATFAAGGVIERPYIYREGGTAVLCYDMTGDKRHTVMHASGVRNTIELDAGKDEAMTLRTGRTPGFGSMLAQVMVFFAEQRKLAGAAPDPTLYVVFPPDCGEEDCEVHRLGGLMDLFFAVRSELAAERDGRFGSRRDCG